MAITLAGGPSPVLWTKNPATFTFIYTGMNTDWKLQLQIIDPSTADVFATVEYGFAGSAGAMQIDIKDLIDPLVSFTYPTYNTSGIQASTANLRDIKLRWRPVNTGSTHPYTTDTQTYRVIKGGIGDLSFGEWAKVNDFSSSFTAAYFYPASHKYLTHVPSGRLMSPDEYGWLLYFSESASVQQKARYKVFYRDNSNATIDVSLPGYGTGPLQYKCYYVPVGITQANLDPTSKGVAYYEVSIIADDTIPATVLTTYKIVADYRPYYDNMVLWYRNSVGGWDQLNCRGANELGWEGDKLDYEQKVIGTTLNGSIPVYDNKMRLVWKVNSGYLGRAHAIALADMCHARELALVYNNKWLPVKIRNKDAVLLQSVSKLENISIEIETSGSFSSMPRQLVNLS